MADAEANNPEAGEAEAAYGSQDAEAVFQALEHAPPSLSQHPQVNPLAALSSPEYLGFGQAAQAAHGKQMQAEDAVTKQMEQSIGDIEGLQPPQMQRAPQQPSSSDVQQGTGQYLAGMTALIGIAGAFGRMNGTVAMTAFAGAMKGFAQGKQQEFENKSAEWKMANQRVLEDNQAKLDQYNLVLANKKLSAQMKLAALQHVASRWGDEFMYNTAQQGHIETVAQLMMRQEQIQAQAGYQSEIQAQRIQRAQDLHDRMEAQKQAGDDLADGIENGKFPADLSSIPAASKPYVVKKLAKDGFDYKKANMEQRAAYKQIQSIYGPQLTRYNATADSVVNTIDEVSDLASELKLTGYPVVNKADILKLTQTNSNSKEGQLATRYITAVNTLKEEFAVLAQGGYAPTESVWNLANAQINENYGVDQMNASLSEIQRLIRYRMQAFEKIDPLHRQISGSRDQKDEGFSIIGP